MSCRVDRENKIQAGCRIHYFQHVSFEGLGNIQPWLEDNHCVITATHWYKNELPASPEDYDVLIVMGGPMSVYDDSIYPWLKTERHAIYTAIKMGKKVLGVCLGAQLIASVLGAQVHKNPMREIGWFPVISSLALQDEPSVAMWRHVFPVNYMPLHWHGDTFTLPIGAISIGSSEACAQQGFIYGGQVVALQYHLELTRQGVNNLCLHCVDELFIHKAGDLEGGTATRIAVNTEGISTVKSENYSTNNTGSVQTAAMMLKETDYFYESKLILHRLLQVLLMDAE